MSVVFPAPLSPTSAVTSPARATKSTDCRTCTGPNDLSMPRNSSAGGEAEACAVTGHLLRNVRPGSHRSRAWPAMKAAGPRVVQGRVVRCGVVRAEVADNDGASVPASGPYGQDARGTLAAIVRPDQPVLMPFALHNVTSAGVLHTAPAVT